MKTKNKRNWFRPFLAIFMVCLTLSFTVIPSFAYGYDEPDTRPIWRDGTESVAVDIWDYGAVGYDDTDFINNLANYFDALYSWGYLPGRLIAVSVTFSGGCNLIFAPNDAQTLDITVPVNSTSQQIKFYNIASTGEVTFAYLSDDGYFLPYNTVNDASSTVTTWFSRTTSQGWFREIHDGIPDSWVFVAGTNDSFETVDASITNNYGDIWLVQFVEFLEDNFNPTYTGPIITNELDIGSIITAYIQSGRTLFDGWFGFEIFGINIAATLISVLVVAIVMFIVKKLRGG